MALVLGLMCISACCLASAFATPPPVKKTGEFKGWTQIAQDRAIYDTTAVPLDVTSNSKQFTSADLAKMQCEMDFTCKGYNVWKVVTDQSAFGLPDIEKFFVLKSKEPVDPWRTIPAYMVKKVDSKIYVRDQ